MSVRAFQPNTLIHSDLTAEYSRAELFRYSSFQKTVWLLLLQKTMHIMRQSNVQRVYRSIAIEAAGSR
jgi:hypothetical protein